MSVIFGQAPETGTGTVTSVNASGGTTGLTFTGGPVTTTGTLTLSGTLVVANGGTGAATLAANNVLLGNGTSALQVVAPGTSGNVLTSNGTTWASTAPAAGVSGANPSASVGLTAVNGVATTYLRSDGAPALDQTIVPTWTGAHAFSKAGAASLPAVILIGAILTGGTGTTNLPHFFIQPTGTTAQTNWSTSGTYIGINAPNAFAGNFIHIQRVSNVDLFKVDNAGAVTATSSITLTSNGVWNGSGLNVGSGSQYLAWGSSTIITAATNGTVLLTNNAASAGIVLRFTTDNQLDLRNRANSAGATVTCDNLTTTTSLTVGTSIGLGAAQPITWSARARLQSSADSKLKFGNNGGTTGVVLDASTDGKLLVRNFADGADGILQAGTIKASALFQLPSYTVATLPAGTQGDVAYATDCLTPVYGAAAAGGGAVILPVFKNATQWVTA